MAFQPLTPAEPEPEPYRFQAWHGLVLVGVMTISVPGIALISSNRSAPVQPAAGGEYAGVADTSLGGGTEGIVDLAGPSTLAIYTIPAGVEVSIDGQPAGVTPYRTMNLDQRSYIVSLRADGYIPLDTVIHLEANPQYLLAVDLVPDGSRPVVTQPPSGMPSTTIMPLPTAPTGTALPTSGPTPTAPGLLPGLPEVIEYSPAELRVSVVPWGSIYLDGQLVVRETDVRQTFTLPPGRHTVAAEHPTLGRTETTIELSPGATRTITLEL